MSGTALEDRKNDDECGQYNHKSGYPRSLDRRTRVGFFPSIDLLELARRRGEGRMSCVEVDKMFAAQEADNIYRLSALLGYGANSASAKCSVFSAQLTKAVEIEVIVLGKLDGVQIDLPFCNYAICILVFQSNRHGRPNLNNLRHLKPSHPLTSNLGPLPTIRATGRCAA